ncbi:hypothetical protein HK405_002706, partial [Cladochytrium tenue]
PEGIRFDNINDKKSYNEWTAYGQSKLANILFAKELAARLEARGIRNIYVNSLHPGIIQTELNRHQLAKLGVFAGPAKALFYALNKTLTEDEGASTSLYLATDPEVEQRGYRGRYFVPVAQVGAPEIPQAEDAMLARR